MDMKKTIYSTLLLVLISTLIGCQKFLDVEPKGLDVIRRVDQFNGLFNNTNLYNLANIRNIPGGLPLIIGYPGAVVMMSDDVFSIPTYLGSQPLAYQNAYQWKGDLFQEEDESNEWGTFYSQNYIYNVIANSVMNASDGTEQEKKRLLAEARANRAYMHLFQVNYFSKPYNPSTAATDLGVPIVITADAGGKNYKRSTVKEVYDFIVSELQAAIPDLPAQTVNRARLAKVTGYYLLGQTYFWMGDYANALTQLNLALSALPNTTVPFSLYNHNLLMPTWVTANQPWRGANRFPAQNLSNENIYIKIMSLNWATARNTVYLKPNVYALFSANDQRKRIYFNNSTNNAIPAPGLPGQQRNAPVSVNWGPNLADLYLMLAECKARANDLIGAKADLETLRRSRMPLAEATVAAATQDALMKVILDERKREFAATGLRWFDMRRLWNDAKYKNIDPIHPLGSDNFTLTEDRLVLKIPPAILKLNPGMQDNQ
jgi:tetratricopeptide (TPR) repeat protein